MSKRTNEAKRKQREKAERKPRQQTPEWDLDLDWEPPEWDLKLDWNLPLDWSITTKRRESGEKATQEQRQEESET